MITIRRPGKDPLLLEFILVDYEGTLASDRRIHPKVKDKLNLLAKRTKIYILAKSDRSLVEGTLRKVNAELVHFPDGESSQRKLGFLRQLGAERTVAIGNGTDDIAMIGEAGLGISVLGREGTSGGAIARADVVLLDMIDALDFLLKPLRHQATLGG